MLSWDDYNDDKAALPKFDSDKTAPEPKVAPEVVQATLAAVTAKEQEAAPRPVEKPAVAASPVKPGLNNQHAIRLAKTAFRLWSWRNENVMGSRRTALTMELNTTLSLLQWT